MKPNEFMLGDWVYNPFTRKNIRLTFGRDIDLAEGLCLDPIPLSEDILTANGFTLVEVSDDGRTPNNDFLPKELRGYKWWTRRVDDFWSVWVSESLMEIVCVVYVCMPLLEGYELPSVNHYDRVNPGSKAFVHNLQHVVREAKKNMEIKL